jgi:hypothetical protein
LLVTISSGAPPVHFSNLHLVGRIRVSGEGAQLSMTDCSIGAGEKWSTRRHLGVTPHQSPPTSEEALSIVGGRVVIARSTFLSHMTGAIGVYAAELTLIECGLEGNAARYGGALRAAGSALVHVDHTRFSDNRAEVSGGAMHVGVDSMVTVVASRFAGNGAGLSGGALQVTAKAIEPSTLPPLLMSTDLYFVLQADGGIVQLSNGTFFERDSADSSGDGVIHVSANGTVTYTLPAPPGRWLNIRRGDSLQLDPGTIDLDFPLACPAGVVGGYSAEEQSSPSCSRPWCATLLRPTMRVYTSPTT